MIRLDAQLGHLPGPYVLASRRRRKNGRRERATRGASTDISEWVDGELRAVAGSRDAGTHAVVQSFACAFKNGRLRDLAFDHAILLMNPRANSHGHPRDTECRCNIIEICLHAGSWCR